MKRVFVVGDIHGELNRLEALLKKWNKESEMLIFLGDYFNRGPEGWKVIQYVKELVENNKNVIALQGNHEEIFLDVIKHPYMLKSYLHDNTKALSTLLDYKEVNNLDITDEVMLWNHMVENEGEIIQFIKDLPTYKCWSKYLFVHAGVDTEMEQIVYMDKSDMKNIREDFIFNRHKLRKVVVFGHTPTIFMHQHSEYNVNKQDDIWISPCRKKIGIDGGLKRLNAIILDKENDDIIINHFIREGEENIKTKKYKR